MVKSAFLVMCAFTVIAGAWLAIMESVLKHSGYQSRMAVDLLIGLQGIAAAMACKAFSQSPVFHSLLLLSAIGLAYIGVAALVRLVQQPHFEGFVLVIGIGIIVQAILTTVVTLRPRLLL